MMFGIARELLRARDELTALIGLGRLFQHETP